MYFRRNTGHVFVLLRGVVSAGTPDADVVFFFFFKQKTAYDVRIRDWSSDVCSSDLVQTVVVAVILAAMSGVMGGEIVMLGLVALPQMFRLGYDRKLTIGLICASGALATLIPPSIIMIVYGLSAEVGIGALFMAGVLPGMMLAALYALFVLVRVHLPPHLAPPPKTVDDIDGS